MKSESTNHWPRTVWDTLTIVMFVALLWLPTVDYFFKIDPSPMPVENRRPAPWPQFGGIRQSREFVTGIDRYFDDHFGFRKSLVRVFGRPAGFNREGRVAVLFRRRHAGKLDPGVAVQ